VLTHIRNRQKLTLVEDRQTCRNDLVRRQLPLKRRYALARRKMETDPGMNTACEMSARSTNVGSNGNRKIEGLTRLAREFDLYGELHR